MSISVNGVSRTSPIANTNTEAQTAASTKAAAGAAAASSDSETKATATPIHFPWLSRLTAELEPVAKQKPSFPSTPSLGENLDQAA